MKIKDLISTTQLLVDWCNWNIKRAEEDPHLVSQDTSYWKNVKHGIISLAGQLLYNCEDLNSIKIKKASKREKKKFSYTEEDGKIIKPYGYMEFNDKKYGVFDDDYGQCIYIRINGESYSGGTYNAYPETEFFYLLIKNMEK